MVSEPPAGQRHDERGTTGQQAEPFGDARRGARLEPVAGTWQRVSPRFIVVDSVASAIAGLIATVVAALPLALSGFSRTLFWPLPWLLPAAVLIGAVVYVAFTPRRVRAIGYLLRRDDFLVRRGLLFQRFAAVPYGRMQLVDVNRGPLARALGLAELKLSTAAEASRVELPGLRFADAEALRDRIVELAESRRAGL